LEIKELGFETICNIYPLEEPRPYEGDVLKHGTHDQKTHGSWADGSESLSEGIGYTKSDLHPQYDYNTDEGYLESYTGPYSDDVNNFLRTGRRGENNLSEDETLNTVDAIDSIIAQTETPRDMTLYRAIGADGFSTFENLKVGDVYTDKGFASTTPDTTQLWDFLPANEGRGAVLQIEVPKGNQVLSVKKYFENVDNRYAPSADILDENEHILPRGSKFQVTGIGLTRQSIVSAREGNPADLLLKVKVVK